MNKSNASEIEDLYDTQIRDLTRRTIRGNSSKMRMRQTDLDDFRLGLVVRKNRSKNVRRNIFTKRYPEDYVYDEEAEEWKNTYRMSM
jgi:RNase P protein component